MGLLPNGQWKGQNKPPQPPKNLEGVAKGMSLTELIALTK